MCISIALAANAKDSCVVQSLFFYRKFLPITARAILLFTVALTIFVTEMVFNTVYAAEDVSLTIAEPLRAGVFLSPSAREKTWNRSVQRTYWEVAYEGYGPPSSRTIPNHLWWDNPHGDDYHRNPAGVGACRYRFNDPADGLVTLNRIKTKGGLPCPTSADGSGSRGASGTIWRRDEYLVDAFETGLTIQLAVQVPEMLSAAQNDAFVVQYVGTRNSFSVYISPHCIKVGHARRTPEDKRHCVSSQYHVARPLNATAMKVYRIVLSPLGNSVAVYINGRTKPYLVGTAGEMPFARVYPPGIDPAFGDTHYEYPVVLFGDNFANSVAQVAMGQDRSAVFALDYLRYSRGAFPPGTAVKLPADANGPLRKRRPPVQPINRPVTAPGLEFDDPDSSIPGHLRISTRVGSKHVYNNLQGLNGNGAWTIEIRARVLPEASYRSFALAFMDRVGYVMLTISPSQVDLQPGGKWAGNSHPVIMDTTDGFHTYRLVRKENDLYVYLFVDDIALPAIADFKLSGIQFNRSAEQTRMSFGWLGQNLYRRWRPSDDLYSSGADDEVPILRVRQGILIDYIRWDSEAPVN